MALPIVESEVVLDKAPYKASLCLRSRTSWVLQVGLNRALLVAKYRTGLMEVQAYRVLEVQAYRVLVVVSRTDLSS